MSGFDEILDAIHIFKKYGNPDRPFHCAHDTLMVCISPEVVSEGDKALLDELGFFPNDEYNCFQSFRYGSA